MFEKIYSFNQIIDIINENVLVVLDIDETILTINGVNDKAKHTDEKGLKSLLKKIKDSGSSLIFLSARDPSCDKLTLIDLKDLDITDNIEVYLCGLNDKGNYLKDILNYKKMYKNHDIVFVDDYDLNLYSVKLQFQDKVKCFQFIISY